VQAWASAVSPGECEGRPGGTRLVSVGQGLAGVLEQLSCRQLNDATGLRTKRSPVLRRGFGESRSGSGFPPMMALVRCLFAHPSVGGAQPTYKSLFYDAFLRRPAAQSRPALRGSKEAIRRCPPARGRPAPASGTTLPIARHRFPVAASPLGLPSLGDPGALWLEGYRIPVRFAHLPRAETPFRCAPYPSPCY